MTNVLIVDDSALMRRIISDIISKEEDIKIAGTAQNGKVGIDKAITLKPDVILMDVEMPEMDGITAVKKIMKENPMPIIMLSAYTKEGSQKTIEALAAGAIDFIAKPSGEISADMSTIREELLKKIRSASKAKAIKTEIVATKKYRFNATRKKIISIACSTGGPQTLERLLKELPANIPAPILIVQHMPPDFTRSLADRLDKMCEIRVREAKNGDHLTDGVALIAPGGMHMTVEEENKEPVIRINKGIPELGVMPCANKLFRSIAPIFKENIICVVLTGMGNDGTDGAKEIRAVHGTIVAEAEESCIIFGMPKEVIKAGLADEIVTLDKMAVELIQLLDI
jgi:two-component system chemotaxis response regulator CheB